MGADISGKRLLLVGCGKMGEAILSGWCSSDSEPASALEGHCFTVVEPNVARASQLERDYGVRTAADAMDVDGRFDIILIAVKPQQLDEVLESLSKGPIDLDDALAITIAAGIPTTRFEESLGEGVRVVRVMPNMPLQVGMGASAVAGGASSTEADVALVNSLFGSLGTSCIVDEGQIDAVCAISGGGPAYVAYMVEALRDAGSALGLDPALAESLALETVGGTYAAMKATGATPEEMRASVSSPGGTTLAALAAMDRSSFKPMFEDAMRAAVDRARELRGEGSA